MHEHKQILQTMLSEGATLDDCVTWLRKNDYGKIASIKMLRLLGTSDLAKAKEIVHFSLAWTNERDQHEQLWAEFESTLSDG